MKNKILFNNLITFGLAHALVDLTCLAVVFGMFGLGVVDLKKDFYLIIIYNIIAFSFQSPIGYLIDSIKRPVEASLLGIFFVAGSTLLIDLPIAAIIMTGIGNALFHVGGGIISLNLTPQKAAAPGIYVSTGAAGLFAGTLIGKTGNFVSWPLIVCLLIISFVIWKTDKPEISYDTKRGAKVEYFELIIFLLILSVAIRGFVGMALSFPWASKISLGIILTSAIILGKALGGIIGDRIGWKKTAMIGLLISIPLLSFFRWNPWLGITGCFFFNLTMPITLTAISNMLPGRAGFAFGLTTLALVIGSLPAYTGIKAHINDITILCSILAATIAIYFALKFYFNNINNNVTKKL